MESTTPVYSSFLKIWFKSFTVNINFYKPTRFSAELTAARGNPKYYRAQERKYFRVNRWYLFTFLVRAKNPELRIADLDIPETDKIGSPRRCFKDVMLFDRALSRGEELMLQSPSKAHCPIRQTTSTECCVFPFLFQNKTFNTCAPDNDKLWYGLTSNLDQERNLGTCKVREECNSLDNGWCGWASDAQDGVQWKRSPNNTIHVEFADTKFVAQCTSPCIFLYSNQSIPMLSSGITFTSPPFNRALSGTTHCISFQYLTYGNGTHNLFLFQQLKINNYTKELVWRIKETSNNSQWKSGQVQISAMSTYKISFSSKDMNIPNVIAIQNIYVKNEKCETIPETAIIRVCGKNISTDDSGFLFSPSYPDYYRNGGSCRWHITVMPDHIVRLNFFYFELEDHPSCLHDYLLIYDVIAEKMIGRYCGSRYPTFLESSGNKVVIIFKSNDMIVRSGFKLQYQAKPTISNDKKSCISYEGCPSECECTILSSNTTSFAVKSHKHARLTAIPIDLPENTKALLLSDNKISRVNQRAFLKCSQSLDLLDLSYNKLIHIETSAFKHLGKLKTLRLNSNFLKVLPVSLFQGTYQLRNLDFSNNLLKSIPSGIFDSMASIRTISLRSNQLQILNKDIFRNITSLVSLYLESNELRSIPDFLFAKLRDLAVLRLNDNKIKKFTKKTFVGLNSLKKLYLHNNPAVDISPDVLQVFKSLKVLQVDGFFLCCYAKKAIPDITCISPKDFFSSCTDLMKNKTLQIFIWVLGLSALLGNIFVIILRSVFKEQSPIDSFLLTNLAIADLLMGVYMLIIAIKDVQFQGEYFKYDLNWRTGRICQLAGALSLLSSEVSVLLLTLITADRFKNIVFLLRFEKLTYRTASIVVAGIWTAGIILSVIPLLSLRYFYDETRRVGYYGRSALCLPLQLTRDKLAGWEYSVTIFIVLNLISFLFILFAYLVMFRRVKDSTNSIRSTSVKRESQMARRMIFIIATDFFCWMPVIIIGILSLLDLFHDPEQQVYAWLAVFVLPLNSSINPILYTFSTPIFQRNSRKLKGIVSSTREDKNTSSMQLEDTSETKVSKPRNMIKCQPSDQTKRATTCKGSPRVHPSTQGEAKL